VRQSTVTRILSAILSAALSASAAVADTVPELPTTLVVLPTWHVPCPGTRSAVACATRYAKSCHIAVGQRYGRLTPLCRDLVIAHEARHCVRPHEHGPVGGTLAECLGGIDLRIWASTNGENEK